MKKAIVVAASAAALMATSAIAADVALPVKAPPAPAPAVSGWTGFMWAPMPG
jgi:opacity protein-like surface antigen